MSLRHPDKNICIKELQKRAELRRIAYPATKSSKIDTKHENELFEVLKNDVYKDIVRSDESWS
ncbi:hypothetical protein SDC9_56157 [bioreactor metagenome]|uniref:Uncharacterized protein n=1 Tax=bioreactor metagenome TaxID=1076179 RepID=A0A644X6P8_9ZZZZ